MPKNHIWLSPRRVTLEPLPPGTPYQAFVFLRVVTIVAWVLVARWTNNSLRYFLELLMT